jgi:hypothetical protein
MADDAQKVEVAYQGLLDLPERSAVPSQVSAPVNGESKVAQESQPREALMVDGRDVDTSLTYLG